MRSLNPDLEPINKVTYHCTTHWDVIMFSEKNKFILNLLNELRFPRPTSAQSPDLLRQLPGHVTRPGAQN